MPDERVSDRAEERLRGCRRAAPRRARAQCLVRRIARAARRHVRCPGRRSRDAPRPQRRRQDDDAEVDHGHRAAARRLHRLRRAGDRPARVEPHRAARHRLLSRGARDLLEPRRRGESAAAARGARGRAFGRPDLRAVPEPEGAPEEPGDEAVGRRAADAGDRPHPAHRRAPAAARRADRRPRAGHRRSRSAARSASSRRRASRSCWSSRISASRRRSRIGIT